MPKSGGLLWLLHWMASKAKVTDVPGPPQVGCFKEVLHIKLRFPRVKSEVRIKNN